MKKAHGKTILMVEDDEDIREILAQSLVERHFKVKTAANGLEALQYLKNSAELPGLIFLDIMMPIMDGYEFRDEQRKDFRLSSIPTVILSADTDVALKTARTGVREYLKKPVNFDRLFQYAEKYSL